MPCIKCSNGKWKYGAKGRCQFDTLEKCNQAAAAIHINKDIKEQDVNNKSRNNNKKNI